MNTVSIDSQSLNSMISYELVSLTEVTVWIITIQSDNMIALLHAQGVKCKSV